MQLSVKIDGLEYVNTDVLFFLGFARLGVRGYAESPRISDGAQVEIQATFLDTQGQKCVFTETFKYVEEKECGCCCHECLQDRG